MRDFAFCVIFRVGAPDGRGILKRMAGQKLSANLLESTIANLRDLLGRLETEVTDRQERMLAVRGDIRDLESQLRRVAANGAVPKTRRRKGENARAVAALFDANPNAALSKQEIADRTGISWSSVQAVLKKGGYHHGEDGLWRRKETGHGSGRIDGNDTPS